jgi:fumarate reductase subunit C
MAIDADWMGPYASADRIFSDNIWILYIILLISVELHATIGLYRLVVKWGWFEGDDYRKSRIRYKKIRNGIIAFYLILGIASLATYMKIGYHHKDNYGQKYHHSSALVVEINKNEVKS